MSDRDSVNFQTGGAVFYGFPGRVPDSDVFTLSQPRSITNISRKALAGFPPLNWFSVWTLISFTFLSEPISFTSFSKTGASVHVCRLELHFQTWHWGNAALKSSSASGENLWPCTSRNLSPLRLLSAASPPRTKLSP